MDLQDKYFFSKKYLTNNHLIDSFSHRQSYHHCR